MKDTKIKDAVLVNKLTGLEKIPVSNGSGQPVAITVNLILDKVPESSTNIISVKITGGTVNIFNSEKVDVTKIKKIILDGEEILITSLITVAEGEHTVDFYLTDDFTNLDYFFYLCPAIIDIDLKHLNSLYITSAIGFVRETSVTKLDMSRMDWSSLTVIDFTMSPIEELDLSYSDFREVTSSYYNTNENLKKIYMNHSNFKNLELLPNFYDMPNIEFFDCSYADLTNLSNMRIGNDGTTNLVYKANSINCSKLSLVYVDCAKEVEATNNTFLGYIYFGNPSDTEIIERVDFSNSRFIGGVEGYGNCKKLILTNVVFEKAGNYSDLFYIYEPSALEEVDLSGAKFNGEFTRFAISSSPNLKKLNLTGADLSSIKSFVNAFDGSLIEHFILSNTTLSCDSMSNMFRNCPKLKTVYFDNIQFDNLESLSLFMYNIESLEEVVFKNCRFKKLTSISNMLNSNSLKKTSFENCTFDVLSTLAYLGVNSEEINFNGADLRSVTSFSGFVMGLLIDKVKKVSFEKANLSSCKAMSGFMGDAFNIEEVSFKGANLRDFEEIDGFYTGTTDGVSLKIDFSETEMQLKKLKSFILCGGTFKLKLGKIGSVLEEVSLFGELDTSGTLYYDSTNSDYSNILENLNENWNSVDINLNIYALKSELSDLATKDEIPTDYLTAIPEAATNTLGGVKKITIDTLADDADIATVVAAYNNLVNKLIESGLAATLLNA